VEPGESLAAIARLYNLPASQIASANSLKDGDPSFGDRLLIPASYHESAAPVRVPRVQARATRPAAGQTHTQSASKKTPVKTRATATAAARRPLHPVAGTLAQMKNGNRSLSR
jgi:LysM repeat protein